MVRYDEDLRPTLAGLVIQPSEEVTDQIYRNVVWIIAARLIKCSVASSNLKILKQHFRHAMHD